MVEATEAEVQGLLAVEVLVVAQVEALVHIAEVQAHIAEVQVRLDLMVEVTAHQVIMVVEDSTFGAQGQGVRLECTLEQECMFLVEN